MSEYIVRILQRFQRAVGLEVDPVKAKERKLRQERERKIERQKRIESLEEKQTWNYVLGLSLEDTTQHLQIKDVTPRNLWMEENFIFSQVQANMPDKTFHSIDQYSLAWKPPDLDFLFLIPLTDVPLQERIHERIKKMRPKVREKILFHFFPTQSNVEMFAPTVHPASLVSYRTKVEIFNKLCEQYTRGLVTLEELNSLLLSNISVWKKILYRNLPVDEQVYHKYLVEEKPIEPPITSKNVESLYLQGSITLQVYEDFVFAERANKKYLESLTYPRPYEESLCIVCSDESLKGIIDCRQPNCRNRICVACVSRIYNSDECAEGPFFTLHRYYCLRLGKVSQISVEVSPPPAYLRELRETGRAFALSQLPPEEDSEEKDDEDLKPDIDKVGESEARPNEEIVLEIDVLEDETIPTALKRIIVKCRSLARKVAKTREKSAKLDRIAADKRRKLKGRFGAEFNEKRRTVRDLLTKHAARYDVIHRSLRTALTGRSDFSLGDAERATRSGTQLKDFIDFFEDLGAEIRKLLSEGEQSEGDNKNV